MPLSVKYIKIKVTCEGVKDPVNVTIKQYPLEYIQGIAGWYSTKDEFTETDRFGNITKYEGIDWQTDRNAHSDWKASSDNNFNAKVKDGNYIYQYYDERYFSRKEGYYYAATTGSKASLGQHNNQMYVVQITSTQQDQTDYKIGHVTTIDPNTKQSKENVVSPAFMLASQLGTVKPFGNGVDASNHCDKYVEVRTGGKKYTDWRLPTAAEIGVICKYQNNKTQDVMSQVLRAHSYWALDGSEVTANENDSDTGYVRCVRDLKPDEVKELENKNE